MTCELGNFTLKEVRSKKNRNKSEASHPVKLPSIRVETDNEVIFTSKINNSILIKRRVTRVKTMNAKSPVKIMDLTDKVIKDIPRFVSQTPVVSPKLKRISLNNGDSPVLEEPFRNYVRNYTGLKKNNMVTEVKKRTPLINFGKESENSLDYIQEYKNKKEKGSFIRAISPWLYQGPIKYSIFV